MRLPFLLLLAALVFPACDSQYDDGYDDGFFDGQVNGQNNAPTNGATFVDFTLDARDYDVSGDSRTATYESDNIDEDAVRARVGRALARAGDGALVMLYIQNELVNIDFGGTSTPYTALPLTRGFDQLVLAPGTPTAPDSVFVVGVTASYEYSFENQDLYFDVVASNPSTDYGSDARTLFDAIVPQRSDANGVRQGPDRLRFRLVTVPATPGGRSSIDLADYAAVKAAYNLPD